MTVSTAKRDAEVQVEAERAMLGGLLMEPDQLSAVSELVGPPDFSGAHSKIYGAMLAVAGDGMRLDRVVLADQLEKSGELAAVGGVEYLAELDREVPPSPNLVFYAKKIRETSTKRNMRRIGLEISRLADTYGGTTEEMLDAAEQKINSLRTAGAGASSWVSPRQAILATVKQLEVLYENPGSLVGLPTGLADLDTLTSGFCVGDLIILAARPSIGKTALALQIAKHTAKDGGGVGLFSLEMPTMALWGRALANEAKIDGQLIRTGKLKEIQWSKLTQAASDLDRSGLYVDDSMITSVYDMRTKARKLQQQLRNSPTPLKMIVVDYLQLAGAFGDGREQAIAEVSRGLKALAKELGVPVLALSQLNRECEKAGRRPRLSDLRDSGAVEQDADMVLFLHPGADGTIEIIIGKQRNGPVGMLEVAYVKEYMRFEDLSRRTQ